MRDPGFGKCADEGGGGGGSLLLSGTSHARVENTAVTLEGGQACTYVGLSLHVQLFAMSAALVWPSRVNLSVLKSFLLH